ncbi:MAG: tRNA uridine-5-carboxymethylaminomethyl(34) synthesis enzyme MnmG, partial [Phycisphaerae bacterium]|nr:tRNA uridine-5-carboxymethylaminomethyl(34) synthesis enzyme MnmG [Phycisphaerae bacterium]
QEAMVHSIAGLERARILQYAYAIEYDFVPPDQIDATLETKRVRGLFMAGQINGTSGYEEAGGLGQLAGINAARGVAGQEALVLGRDESYVGVMIDDLITRPPVEPYRMFTSRAEYRLLLRSDNADARLTPVGRRIGLVDDARWKRFRHKQELMDEIRQVLAVGHRDGRPIVDWLRRPEVRIDDVIDRAALRPGTDPLLEQALEAVEIEVKYGGYIDRQQRQVERFRQMESRPIPSGFDFAAIPELRREARERLAAIGPRSIGQASRISGINPADITILLVYLDRRRRLDRG